MDEKTLVSDALVGINGELKMFGDMIPQTENKELKQCLKQIRNQCEMAQEKCTLPHGKKVIMFLPKKHLCRKSNMSNLF